MSDLKRHASLSADVLLQSARNAQSALGAMQYAQAAVSATRVLMLLGEIERAAAIAPCMQAVPEINDNERELIGN